MHIFYSLMQYFLFLGCKEVSSYLCQQTLKQNKSGGNGSGHSVCRWSLLMPLEWIA